MSSLFFHIIYLFFSIQLLASHHHDVGNQNAVLDDEEQKISEQFIHEGKAEQQRKALCKKAGKGENCDDEKDLNLFFGLIPPQGVEIAAKVYGMVIGSGALGDKFALKEDNPKADSPQTSTDTAQSETPSNQSPSEGETPEEVSDNCRYIAAATEGVAQITQFTKSEEIQNRKSNESMQAQALYKTAEMHDSQSDTSSMQAIGWGATAGCYGFIAATQPINIFDASFLLKLGGTSLLTALFYEQSLKHKEYAKELRKIAKGLPGQGDCNPVTEVYCYCSQESTKNDAKYCEPKTHDRPVAKGSKKVVCTDENMQADPNCNCAATDSCYDKKLIGALNNLKNADAGFLDNYKDFGSIMKGEHKSARSSNAAIRRGAARNTRKLRKIAAKLPNKHLNSTQKKTVDAFNKLGIPRRIGAMLATTPIRGNPSAAGRFKNNFRNYTKNRRKGKNNKVLRFSGGHGKRATPNQQKSFDFSKFIKKKKNTRKTSSSKILNFAKKATNQAEISNQKNTSIFKIISKRYQLSSMRRLK